MLVIEIFSLQACMTQLFALDYTYLWHIQSVESYVPVVLLKFGGIQRPVFPQCLLGQYPTSTSETSETAAYYILSEICGRIS